MADTDNDNDDNDDDDDSGEVLQTNLISYCYFSTKDIQLNLS